MNKEFKNSDIEQWRVAKTFDELGEPTANWLEGKLSYYPYYRDDVDSETTPISPPKIRQFPENSNRKAVWNG